MKDIFILNSIFVKEVIKISNKVANGEITAKERELKNQFLNKAIKEWEKIMDLFTEGYKAGSEELDKRIDKFEQLLKNEGLL
jgi:hypothetical protein